MFSIDKVERLVDNDPAFEKKVEDEIRMLVQGVADFDYSQLRAMPVPKKGEKEEKEEKDLFHRATEQSVKELLALFSSTFLYSPDKKIRQYFAILARLPLACKHQVFMLGEALLKFKEGVQEVELHYFKDREYGESLAELRTNSTWVVHFHYIIEQYLDVMPTISPFEYKNTLKNIQHLSEHIYRWCSYYSEKDTDRYKTFRPMSVGLREASSFSEPKSKVAFMQFFSKLSEKRPHESAPKQDAHPFSANELDLASSPSASKLYRA